MLGKCPTLKPAVSQPRLHEGTAMKSGLSRISSSAQWSQLTKDMNYLNIRKTVGWCRATQFHHFVKEIIIIIFKNAWILILIVRIASTQVFRKCPRVRQSGPQMKKLLFLEIWKMNWERAKTTNHCSTFMWGYGSM